MELTQTEAQIVRELKRSRVAKWADLARQHDCSRKTVQRAVAKVGYLCSINANGAFIALRETAPFDQHGLWTYRSVRFSRYGNLAETLQRLVEQSSAGFTGEELEELVGTHVHNHISRLIRQGDVGRCFLGRRAVYLAADPQQGDEQREKRLQQRAPSIPTARDVDVDVPPGLDPITVIQVLLRLLKTPEASVVSIARSLQARQWSIRAEEIRRILDFYELKKTKH